MSPLGKYNAWSEWLVLSFCALTAKLKGMASYLLLLYFSQLLSIHLLLLKSQT